MNRIMTLLAMTFVALSAIPNSEAANRNACRPTVKSYGNLTVETYSAACHTLTPFYWKNGVTRSGAEAMLRRMGIDPISVIPGGFNTNRPGLREPIDYVEIENKIVVGRSDFWPILYEAANNGNPYLGIARGEVYRWKFENGQWRPAFKDIPDARRWALAAGPWIRNDTSALTVRFFGNDASGKPWLEYIYRRNGAALVLAKRVDHRKTWDYVHHRLVFDWTQRRAVFLSKEDTAFAIVKGRSDALSIGKLMAMLGYAEAIMMDGGSATATSVLNPVYLAVTAKK